MSYPLISHIEDNMELLKTDEIIAETESIIVELLDTNTIKDHLKISRKDLNIRRAIQGIAASIGVAIPIVGQIYPIWLALAEGGVIPSTEKRNFIRLQGLTDMHIKRITKSTNSQFYSHELSKIQDDFSNTKYSKIEDGFYELIAREAALVVTGYIRTENPDKLDNKSISKLSADIMEYQKTYGKNTGTWNRIKNFIGGGMGIAGGLAAMKPLISYLGHFHQLSKVNNTDKPKQIASAYLKEYLKLTNS